MPDTTPSGIDQFHRLVRQIHLMKQYCADEGVPLPPAAAEAIAKVEGVARPEIARMLAAKTSPPSQEPAKPESAARATAPRINAPPDIVGDALLDAWTAHSLLAALVKPATPSSVEWTTASVQERDGRQRVVFVWGMVAAAVIALAAFIWVLYADARTASLGTRIPEVTALVARFAEDKAWQAPAPGVAGAPAPGGPGVPAELVKLGTVINEEVVRLRDTWPMDTRLHELTERTRIFLDQFLEANSVLGGPRTGAGVYDTTSRRHDIATLATEWRAFRDDQRTGSPDGTAPDYILLVFAGAVGAAFFNLYNAHQYIVDRTFDRAYINRYIIRFFLGMVSGLVLGHFGGELIKTVTTTSHGVTLTFSRAFLAILGGYAVESVNLILVRIADAIAALFRGGFDEIIKAKTGEITARADKDKVVQRNEIVKELQSMRGLNEGTFRERLDALIKRLLE